jgi:GR25 family glycosyltransferase involved in LPS biosynthesis
MKVFSFCIYGSEKNYYDGLLENIEMINEYFPDFEIYIYKGFCDPSWTFQGKNIKVIETFRQGLVNTLYRFLPLSQSEIGFVRDADSRINERDRWCIQSFLKSDKSYHIIRDHYWHKSLIMGGMFGWKTPCYEKIEIPSNDDLVYGFEELYLSKTIYPLIKPLSLVHTNNHAYAGEHVELIDIPQVDQYDFIGNVIWNNVPKFEYFIGDIFNQVIFLRQQDQFKIVKHITDKLNPLSIPYHSRSKFYDSCYSSNYYLKDILKCQYWLSQYEFAELNHHTYTNSNYMFGILGKKIVATFDSQREPTQDEVVIVYGNYPDWHHALPCTSKIYRHVSLFFQLKHDIVEYDPSWEAIDTIYVLNLKERSDRFTDTLTALCSVRAPLHRIHHYKAERDGLPPYVGATKNHVDVMKHFKESGKNNCLILEDDVIFIDDSKFVSESLNKFFSSDYDYNICFLSLSKTGERLPLDELLSITKQPCTTSSAYFLKKETVDKVIEVADEGLLSMIKTSDHHNYCIDRYWSKLTNLFFFKKKLVFQRPSFSNLTQTINFHLD